MIAALAIPMQDHPTSRTETSAPRALGRFWPSSRGDAGVGRPGWRETLARFWPRAVVPARPRATKPASRSRPALAPVRRKPRVSAPRKLRPGARPRSLGLRRLSGDERRQLQVDERALRRAGVYAARPRTYGDCEDRPGPCGYVSCRMNLFLEVDEPTGAVKLNFPDKQIDELTETCALRVIDRRGALSLEEVGKLINLTQERVSQIEETGVAKLKRRLVDARRLLRVARPEVEEGDGSGGSSNA